MLRAVLFGDTTMATDSWINETLYPDWGQRFLVKRELARVQERRSRTS